jgi:hypothetical protein
MQPERRREMEKKRNGAREKMNQIGGGGVLYGNFSNGITDGN